MGFELSYSITAEPCMESVICYGMESMQSIVWNQAAGKYTFGDAIPSLWLECNQNEKAVHQRLLFHFGCGGRT